MALKHLRTMETADLVNQRAVQRRVSLRKKRRVIGVAQVVTLALPDPKLDNTKRVVIQLRAVQRVPLPVTLSQIKQDRFLLTPPLADYAVVLVSESH